MKKLLTLIAGITLTATTSFAQLTNGSHAPNWTMTDINGNSWDLYTLLAQGKPVFFDVSATWCNPCWNYHNGRAMDSLYNIHGPAGTQDQMCYVFFIEGDATTNTACLTSANGCNSTTQGDWVSTTDFPIIDMPANSTFATDYSIAYFPTIYMVCPDQKVYEVGQVGYASLVAAMNTCPFNLDALPSNANLLTCTTNYSPTFTLKNNSLTAALTTCDITYKIDNGAPMPYSWSGNIAAGQSATVTLPSVAVTMGNHTLMVTTSNPNASTDNNLNNDSHTYSFGVVTANGTPVSYTNSFATTVFPYSNWELGNPDNDITWAHVATNTGCLKFDCYNDGNRGTQDAFIVEPVDLTGTTTPSLKFDVAHRIYSAAYTEKLDVFVSTDCGATWTSVYSKAGATLASVAGASTAAFTPTATQWRNDCVDLTPYAGNNKVFIKFVGTNDFGNNMYVDNINVSNSACATGIVDINSANGMNIFPNPVSELVNVNFNLDASTNVTVNVYNAVGALVSTKSLGEMTSGTQNVQISTEGLSNGLYMVELIAGQNRSVSRMTVAH
jgi:hypothetical protein